VPRPDLGRLTMARSRSKTGQRLPRTARGEETLQRFLRGAEEVFRERGYEEASVSAICRRVGLAQGTFYLYFANKEEVYVRLVGGLQTNLIARLRGSIAATPDPCARLLNAYNALLDYITEHVGLFQVFREAEFVRQEIPTQFYEEICAELIGIARAGTAAGAFRDLDPEVVAYAILGAVLFLCLRFAVWGGSGIPHDVRKVGADLILHGIAAGSRRIATQERPHPDGAWSGKAAASSDEPEGGEATRRALLVAAERAFGEAGFHGTTVSTVTYLAGVGQGTFYLYFPSKVAIFTELVRAISRDFRRRQTLAVAQCADRLAAEAEGLRSFLRWVQEHPGAYRIVREAEFVDEGVGKWYYTRLAEGYARGLATAMDRGEIRRCDPEALAYALVGVAHLGGQRWVLWGDARRPAENVLPTLVAFILEGVERATESGAGRA